MSPLTRLVSCMNWRGISFSSMEAEVNPRAPRHHVLGVLWNSSTAFCQSRRTFGSGWMDTSHGAKIQTDLVYWNPEGPVWRPTIKRSCQHLVGKFFSYSACRASGHVGGNQAGIQGTLCSRRGFTNEAGGVYTFKAGGDSVIQYLNKFNHLSQYAINQVETDLKKKNCFMRGLNDQLQWKMATCLDLTYNRVVSTTLSVEAKNSGQGKTKRYGGEGSSQGFEKRSRLVICPFNPNCSSPRPPAYPFKQPVLFAPLLPPLRTISRVPLVLVSPPYPVPLMVALIVGSLDNSSRTIPIQSRMNQILNILLGTHLKAKEMWPTVQ